MATKQDESDTLNQFSEKDQRFIKEDKLMFIIQTDLPENIYILAAYYLINNFDFMCASRNTSCQSSSHEWSRSRSVIVQWQTSSLNVQVKNKYKNSVREIFINQNLQLSAEELINKWVFVRVFHVKTPNLQSVHISWQYLDWCRLFKRPESINDICRDGSNSHYLLNNFFSKGLPHSCDFINENSLNSTSDNFWMKCIDLWTFWPGS